MSSILAPQEFPPSREEVSAVTEETEPTRNFRLVRGGRFSTGENLTTEQANYDGNYPYNNHVKGEYRQKTVAVDSLKPNTFGLYNMHGNVWEWCSDWYGSDYYKECKGKGVVKNPQGPATGSDRVLRGGSWYDDAENCRSASRITDTPGARNSYVGFRLVFVP